MDYKNTSPFNSKSTAPSDAISPYNKGNNWVGVDGIEVRLTGYPDENQLKEVIAKMSLAPTGRAMEVDEDFIVSSGNEIFKGGILNRMESFNFTFEIERVSRACTHQIVRTRKGANYQQQTMRYTYYGENFDIRVPEFIHNHPNPEVYERYIEAIDYNRKVYSFLYDNDITFQDARFVCPISTVNYIMASYPIATWLSTYAYRRCPMMMWETVHVFQLMGEEVIKQLPFMKPMVKIGCEKTKKCMYQGLEKTDSICDFEWNRERVYDPSSFLNEVEKLSGRNESNIIDRIVTRIVVGEFHQYGDYSDLLKSMEFNKRDLVIVRIHLYDSKVLNETYYYNDKEDVWLDMDGNPIEESLQFVMDELVKQYENSGSELLIKNLKEGESI